MNILIIGNGFDLAHELPTGYPDFLGFCRMIIAVYAKERNKNADKVWENLGIKLKREINTERLRMKFLELYSTSIIENDEYRGSIVRTKTFFDELSDDIENNIWIEYFLQNPMYQKENWIDFESEISKVIQSVDEGMKLSERVPSSLEDEVYDLNNEFIEEYFFKYDAISDTTDEIVIGSLDNITYRIVRDKLYRDLNKLIRALEIYLTEYVGKIECTLISPDIEDIVIRRGIDEDGTERNIISKVLSFNYSNTYERKYLSRQTGLIDSYIDYIHGKADIDNTIESNNMVLGIDEYLPKNRKNKDIEFIAFKKFYQRIYKETGCKYKEWIDNIKDEYERYLKRKADAIARENMYISDTMHRVMARYEIEEIKAEKCKKHYLFIFGHSLDVTDGDILRDLILNDNVYTTIYYLNKDAMGQQITNLVKVIGQDELIRRTGGNTKTIEFKLQQDMVDRK